MGNKFDVICAGMALVDSIIKGFDPKPVSASGFRAESCTLNAGGEAVNEAVAAARLGLSAAILCSLGEDAAGEVVESVLRRSGVDTGFIVRAAERPTPVTTMFVKGDGTRQSVTNRSHSRNFHPERYTDCLGDTRALILGSLFRAPFDDPEVIRAVLLAAREKGVRVFADTKLPNFRFLTLDDIADCLPLIDCITPNEDEARYYTGREEPEEMADVFLARGAGSVIVKLGGRGCFYKDSHTAMSLPAYDIRAVDATGAGDNFVAGFVSELLRGGSTADALGFANACGAICTTAVGAGTALQSREQVLEFMQSRAL